MQTSEHGILLTKNFEGYRGTAYQDSNGIWTLGYGETQGISAGMTCTPAQADQWLRAYVAVVDAAMTRELGSIKLTQNQWDALSDFGYNLGANVLLGSTLLRDLQAGNYAAAAEEIPRWCHDQSGDVIQGLLDRRNAEKSLFLTA
jgi:lysozyme